MSTSVDLERAPWLGADDKRLAREIRELLARLLTVSEAPALDIGQRTSQSKPGSKDLGEVKRDRGGAPAEDFSLYEHYRFRFAAARDDLSRRVILCHGRVALRTRTLGPSPYKTAGHGQSLSSEVERAQRESAETLIQDGEGVHAAEIAAETGWPVGWVKTVRLRAGRDEDYGHPRPKWRELGDDQREVLARDFFERSYSQRQAAKELGIGASTIAPYWPPTRRLRARAA